MRTRASAVASILILVVGITSAASAATGWHTIGTPQPSTNYRYQARYLEGVAAFSPTDVWTDGAYHDHASGRSVPLVLHWTGSWHRASLPGIAGGASLAFLDGTSANNLWAAGYGGTTAPHIVVLHRTASGWHRVTTSGVPGNFSLFAMAEAGPTNLWLGGYEPGVATPFLEHWNGTSWSQATLPVPSGAQGQINGLGFAPGAAHPVAVGYTVASSTLHPYAARWSGGAWHMQVATHTSGEFRAVVMLSATNGWAVGTRYPTSNSFETLAGHWNGTSWSTSAGKDRPGSNTLLAVSAGGAKNVWATGYSSCATCSNNRTLAEHWTGSSWSISPTTNPATGSTRTDMFFGAGVVPKSTQVWAVGAEGPPQPANNAEFILAERNN